MPFRGNNTSELPSSIRDTATWMRLADQRVPAMIVRAGDEDERPRPLLLWLHGRTVNKELDPGRPIRLTRNGISYCSIDLPGHGERYDQEFQKPDMVPEIIRQVMDEIDPVIDELVQMGIADRERLAIGGMSAGGMATLARLARPHGFHCATVEATCGKWEAMGHRGVVDESLMTTWDPMSNLDSWRSIPLLAIHARYDAWIPSDSQAEFIEAVRRRSSPQHDVRMHVFDRTGAPFEHVGFGKYSTVAKNMQSEFLQRWLLKGVDGSG